MEKKDLPQRLERTIWRLYWCSKRKGMVRSVDVARHMGVSKPSVCHAVVTLKRAVFSLWMRTSFSA